MYLRVELLAFGGRGRLEREAKSVLGALLLQSGYLGVKAGEKLVVRLLDELNGALGAEVLVLPE